MRLVAYHMAQNFGGGKLWWISAQNVFGRKTKLLTQSTLASDQRPVKLYESMKVTTVQSMCHIAKVDQQEPNPSEQPLEPPPKIHKCGSGEN